MKKHLLTALFFVASITGVFAQKNQNGLEVKCKKDGDTDQQEVYDGLPNIYEMDFCF